MWRRRPGMWALAFMRDAPQGMPHKDKVVVDKELG